MTRKRSYQPNLLRSALLSALLTMPSAYANIESIQSVLTSATTQTAPINAAHPEPQLAQRPSQYPLPDYYVIVDEQGKPIESTDSNTPLARQAAALNNIFMYQGREVRIDVADKALNARAGRASSIKTGVVNQMPDATDRTVSLTYADTGEPAVGIQVSFTILSGNGYFDIEGVTNVIVATNASGDAIPNWVLGKKTSVEPEYIQISGEPYSNLASRNRIQYKINTGTVTNPNWISLSNDTYTVYALADAANKLILEQDSYTSQPGTWAQIIYNALDQFDNPVANFSYTSTLAVNVKLVVTVFDFYAALFCIVSRSGLRASLS